MRNDDEEIEWTEFPDDEARVLTSISQECMHEECDRCPGTFDHPHASGETVFSVHACHRVDNPSSSYCLGSITIEPLRQC